MNILEQNSKKQSSLPTSSTSPKLSTSPTIITIDGPSGSGKGTIAQLVAQKLGYAYLDSGALYRIVGYGALKAGIDLHDAKALSELARNLDVIFTIRYPLQPLIIYQNEDISLVIRSEEVASAASKIAVLPEVRKALLDCQRSFAKEPGLVTDGRDMGTVIFPQAKHKFYLTASVEKRAERRVKQLQESGKNASLHKILEDLKLRDARDSGRSVAPLKAASDAILIDTTKLSIDEVLAQVMDNL